MFEKNNKGIIEEIVENTKYSMCLESDNKEVSNYILIENIRIIKIFTYLYLFQRA